MGLIDQGDSEGGTKVETEVRRIFSHKNGGFCETTPSVRVEKWATEAAAEVRCPLTSLCTLHMWQRLEESHRILNVLRCYTQTSECPTYS